MVSFRHDILPLKDLLYRLALRITAHREDAEDAVQDTMAKLWHRREALQGIESIEAYCMAVCRNIALDKLKLSARHADHTADHLAAHAAEPSADPCERAAHRDSLERVKRLIDQLPEKQRTCMQLRDFEGRTYREIATAMGITEDQVKVNIFRARQAVKKRIDNDGL